MKKSSFFLLLIIFASQVISAQEYYIKGYVVKHNGEKVHGLVSDLNWKYNPDTVFFKKDENSSVQFFTPKDISEFYTDDNNYVSYTGSMDISPIEPNELFKDSEITFDTVSVFLKLINKGKINLYDYHSSYPEKHNYYIKKGNDNITELIYQKQIKIEDGKRIVHTNTYYKNQLSYLMQDCPQSISSMNSAKYELSSLERRVYIYNNDCSSKDYEEHNKKQRKIKLKFGILPGVSVQSIKVPLSYDLSTYFSLENPKVMFMPSLNFEFFFPRGRNATSIYLFMSRYGFSETVVEETTYTVRTYIARSSYIKTGLGFKFYIVPDNKIFQPYVYTGVQTSNGLRYSETNYNIQLDHTFQTDLDYSNFIDFKAGVGLLFKDRFVFDFCYDFNLMKDKNINYRSFGAAIGYSFTF